MLKVINIQLVAVIVAFFCFNANLIAQHQISKYDKCWAVIHPFAALIIKKELPKAMVVYEEVKTSKLLDTLESGGKLDAFRHVYTMAYLAKKVKRRKLNKLGIAHEKGNKAFFYKNKYEFGERADSLACEMDLRNNKLGLEIASQYRNLNAQDLKTEVIKQINDGNAWCLMRNSEGYYTTCSNVVINFKFYIGKWYVPKCLIMSNK